MFCSLPLLFKRLREGFAFLTCSLVLAITGPTFAHGSPSRFTPVDVSALPPGSTKRFIVRLSREFRDKGAPDELLTGPLHQAKRALERSHGARVAGDIHHGARLQRLAHQWAEFASTLFRTIQAERRARQAGERLQRLSAKLDRGRTLLAEQHARRGRLRASLEKAAKRTIEKSPRSKDGPATDE